MPLALLVALAASTGFLRVAHDLTSHVCSCVSGLIASEESHDHGHGDHGCHAGHEGGESEPHDHKHPADEHDCEICAVLHAVRHATPLGDAPAVVSCDVVAEAAPRPLCAVYADAPVRAWSARGPPMIA